jgi:nucleoside-diphosphate-sugar epimerase
VNLRVAPTALVIGGTGPTGPSVVEGLAARGYQVTILHGGQHEVELPVPSVRHIHVDPHFKETLEDGLQGESFDLVVAQYGRLRIVVDVLRGRTRRLIAIGGATARRAAPEDPRWGRVGRPYLLPESHEVLATESGPDKFAFRLAEALEALFAAHEAGWYSATYLAYPVNYGPRQPGPSEWSVIRRALDRRSQLIVADGGLKLESRIFTRNAVNAVMAAVDNPVLSAGKSYNVSDVFVYSMRQRIEYIASIVGHTFEFVDMPYEYAWPCHPMWNRIREHRLCDSTNIRAELGYRDEYAPEDGIEQTVEWLLHNPPTPDGEEERQLGDPFDYAAEDELIRWWGSGNRNEFGESPLPRGAHIYRHPTKPGEEWTRPDEWASTSSAPSNSCFGRTKASD